MALPQGNRSRQKTCPPVPGYNVTLNRANASNEETQRQAYWHLHHMLENADQYLGLDESLFPTLTRKDVEAVAIMMMVWLRQDTVIAEMESFCERFQFDDSNGKRNLLDIFQAEQD